VRARVCVCNRKTCHYASRVTNRPALAAAALVTAGLRADAGRFTYSPRARARACSDPDNLPASARKLAGGGLVTAAPELGAPELRSTMPGRVRTRLSRERKRHEDRGDVLVQFWMPRWLRSAAVHRLGLAEPGEMNDGDELGQRILEALIQLARRNP
jgi:hypothetical protein